MNLFHGDFTSWELFNAELLISAQKTNQSFKEVLMPRVFSYLFLVILFTSKVYSMTMDEAVNYALKNNPEIQALRLEKEVAKNQLEKAKLLFPNNPTIEGEISKKEKSIEEGNGKYTDYSIKLSQEFEIAGQRILRINIAEKELSKIAFEIMDKERIITYDVKNTFAKALVLKKKEELAEQVVKLKEELLYFTRIKLQAGDVSNLEVNIAEVELSKARAELLSISREYREVILNLQSLIGLKYDFSFNVEGEILQDIFPLPNKEILKKLVVQRPDIKSALVETDKTELAIRLTKRETVPNITLSMFYAKDEQRNTAGLTASIPIPFFNKKEAEMKEARVRAEQAKIKLSGIERIAENEFEESYNTLISSLNELSLFKKEILDKAMENLSLINFAFREGKVSFYDVRLAQKDIVDIQFAYLDAQLRTRIAINTLEKIIGGNLK